MMGRYSEKALDVCRVLAICAATSAPISTAVTSIACVLMILTWALSGRVANTLSESWRHPLGKIIIVFYVWLLIGTLYAETDWPARLTTISSWKKLAYAFLLLGLFNSAIWQARFVHVYCLVMSVAAVVSFGLWSSGTVVNAARGGPGIFMTNYATQSIAFIAAVLGITTLVLTQSLTKNWRIFFGLAMPLLLFSIFFASGARSAYIAIFTSIVFLLTSLYGIRKLPHIIMGAAVGIAVLVASSSNVQSRITLLFEEQANYQSIRSETSVGARMVFYKNTLSLIKEKPLLGFGTSGFKSAFLAQLEQQHPAWAETSDPHNQYLFVWAENGIIGLVLFLAYIFTALKQGIANKPYGLVAASFLIAVSTSSLFNSHFKTFSEGHLLAFFLGALLARPYLTDKATSDA